MTNVHRNFIQCRNTGCLKFYDCKTAFESGRRVAKLKYKPMSGCFKPIEQEEYEDVEGIDIEEVPRLRNTAPYRPIRWNAADMEMQQMPFTITTTTWTATN